MQLTRRQSLALAWSILAVFFLIVVYFSSSQRPEVAISDNSEEQSIASSSSSSIAEHSSSAISSVSSEDSGSSSSSTGGVLKLEKFHRSETKEGKLLWEIIGDRGEFVPQDNSINITNATISSRLKGGNLITLKTPQANAQIAGTTLTNARARQGVEIVLDNESSLTAQTMDYSRISGSLSTTGPIALKNPIKGSITSENLSGNVERQEFTFQGNVVTTILPLPKSESKGKS